MNTPNNSTAVTLMYACTLCGVPCTADRDDEHALARACEACHGLIAVDAHLDAMCGRSIAFDAATIVDYVGKIKTQGGRMHPLALRLQALADAHLEELAAMTPGVMAAEGITAPTSKRAEDARVREALANAIRINAEALAEFLPSMLFTVETIAHMRGLERDLIPMCDEVRRLLGPTQLNRAVRS